MPKRPCLDCGALSEGARCPTHRRARDRATLQAKRTRRPRATTAEETRRSATVQAWRTRHGPLCPGWQRPAHQVDERTNPLTADHEVPVGAGGAEDGQLTVLCRACNGAKADSTS